MEVLLKNISFKILLSTNKVILIKFLKMTSQSKAKIKD